MKQKLFRTAQALVACRHFQVGEFVSVKYEFTNSDGTDWYIVWRDDPEKSTIYPAHHLTQFCL